MGGGVGVNGGGVGVNEDRGDAPTLTLPRRGRGFMGIGEGICWVLGEGIIGGGGRGLLAGAGWGIMLGWGCGGWGRGVFRDLGDLAVLSILGSAIRKP